MRVRSYELLVASYWLKQFSLREKGGCFSAEKGVRKRKCYAFFSGRVSQRNFHFVKMSPPPLKQQLAFLPFSFAFFLLPYAFLPSAFSFCLLPSALSIPH